MVKKVNKKVKVDPIHATVCLVIAAGIIFIILFKRLMKKKKIPEEKVDIQSLINDVQSK
jgi:hypothetical protein